MDSNWTELELGGVINLKRGYDLPASKRKVGKIPIMSSSGINGYHNEEKVKGPGVITGRSGQLGKVFYIKDDYWPLNTTLYVEDFKNNYPKYVYYLLQTLEFEKFNAGSSVPTLNRNHVHKLKIKIPAYNIQKKIANILYMVDEKIQLNKEIVENLEEISQTLFKQWFIDFEFPNEEGKPYKSSGGEMVQSELGNIPKNWTFSYFSNYVKHTIGGDWGKENVEKNYVEQVSIIRGADIPELIKGTDNKVPTRFILKKNYENKKLLPGDIVIEISGGSPTQSTGRSIFINKNIISRYNDKVLCTNFCRIIRPVDFNKGIWLQMYINYLYKKNVFFNFENGTTGIKNLDLNAVLNKYKIFSPSEDTIHLFSERMRVILDSIQSLGMENKRLANLRDTLLPKLLSGEIEIPDELEV